jgi:hypothetical protein
MRARRLSIILVTLALGFLACKEDDDGGEGGAEAGDGDGDCSAAGVDCSADPTTCCNGNTCVQFDTNTTCAANCSIGSDCADCCCEPLTGGGAVCTANSCAGTCGNGCSGIGSLCGVNGDCCDFAAGDAWCVGYGELGVYCASSCVNNSDCVSNCCAPLDGGGAACSPAEFCSPDQVGPGTTAASFTAAPGVEARHGGGDPASTMSVVPEL